MNRRSKMPTCVSDLSSGSPHGRYYDEVSHWWVALTSVLRDYYDGLTPCVDCPVFYNNEGRGSVMLQDAEGNESPKRVVYTYYRMQSGRWEIVAYVP